MDVSEFKQRFCVLNSPRFLWQEASSVFKGVKMWSVVNETQANQVIFLLIIQ